MTTIKDLRKNLNMSQSEFAEYFHIPQRTIQNWEQGVREPASYIIEMMERIANSEKKYEVQMMDNSMSKIIKINNRFTNEELLEIIWTPTKIESKWLSSEGPKNLKIPKYIRPDNITIEGLRKFISERIPPKDQIGFQDTIKDLYGLDEYNAWEICKKTHGTFGHDVIEVIIE